MLKTECIRVYADINQINNCIKDLHRVQSSIKKITAVLNLAGNEVRLKILYVIHKEKQLCVCDLSDILSMTIPAISQHLRKMKDGGVLVDKKVGQTVFYLLNKEKTGIIQPLLKLITSSSPTLEKVK